MGRPKKDHQKPKLHWKWQGHPPYVVSLNHGFCGVFPIIFSELLPGWKKSLARLRDFEDTQMLAQLFADMLQTDEEGEHKVAWKMLGILWYVLVIFYRLPKTFFGESTGEYSSWCVLKTPSRNPRLASRSFRICWKPINLDPTYRPGELISKMPRHSSRCWWNCRESQPSMQSPLRMHVFAWRAQQQV